MEISNDTEFWLTLGCLLAMLVGFVGIVLPIMPGLPICFGAVFVWALFANAGWGKWLVVGLAAVFTVVGEVAKYIWPGRRIVKSGVPTLSLLAGALLGIVGFFFIPVIGLPLGFIAGIWATEAYRYRGFAAAWPATKEALKATGLSILIELFAGMLIAFTWVLGLLFA